MKRTMARLAVAFSMGPALAAAALAAFSGPARAGGDGRLLTTDAAEALDAPVLGLQRSALPLAGGVAIDTALLADLGLVANLGLRWAAEVGVQRFVAGARWAQFVGAAVTSSVARQYDARVIRFAPSLSGPVAYGVYGVGAGPADLQAEVRWEGFEQQVLSLTGGVRLRLGDAWSIIAEGGARMAAALEPRGAAGLRYQGPRFGLALGAAYADLHDRLLGIGVPVVPVLDLSWSFE